MNDAQIEALKIIKETAIQTIAQSHSSTVELVELAIKAGQEVVCKQFEKLMTEGVKVVAEMGL